MLSQTHSSLHLERMSVYLVTVVGVCLYLNVVWRLVELCDLSLPVSLTADDVSVADKPPPLVVPASHT